MSKRFKCVTSLVVGLALLCLVVVGLSLTPALPADAQVLIGTPQLTSFGGDDVVLVPYMDAFAMSGTTKDCSSGQQTAAYVDVDIQSVVVMDSAGEDNNVITCTLEFSNDNTNWCVPAYTTTNVTTDTTSCDRFSLFGRYSRVCCVSHRTDDTYTVTQQAKAFN